MLPNCENIHMHVHKGLLPQTIAEAQKKNLILKDYTGSFFVHRNIPSNSKIFYYF